MAHGSLEEKTDSGMIDAAPRPGIFTDESLNRVDSC